MDTSVKHCTVNAWVGGGWYPKGQERLQRSLIYHGDTSDHLFYQDEWPKRGYNHDCPYNIKASCIEKAIEKGYKRILWADCSFWTTKYPMPLWDEINDKGYFFWKSGFNCAQVCSDKALDYFEITRDEAEKMHDCSSSLMGFNMDNPDAQQFLRLWIQAAKDGIFEGSRQHDNQSSDPRFLYHRQDQCVASLIIGKLGLTMNNSGKFCSIYGSQTDETIFLMQGI